MTRCSASLIIKGNANQNTRDITIYLSECLVPKMEEMTNVIEDEEKRSAYALLRGMYTAQLHGNTLWRLFKKFKRERLCDPLSHSWICSQRKWNHCLKERSTYSRVHCSIIYSSLGIGTTWVSFNRWLDWGQCDVTYIGKYYLAIRLERNPSICGYMDENWRALH